MLFWFTTVEKENCKKGDTVKCVHSPKTFAQVLFWTSVYKICLLQLKSHK